LWYRRFAAMSFVILLREMENQTALRRRRDLSVFPSTLRALFGFTKTGAPLFFKAPTTTLGPIGPSNFRTFGAKAPSNFTRPAGVNPLAFGNISHHPD
jgi:hypothetical protein